MNFLNVYMNQDPEQGYNRFLIFTDKTQAFEALFALGLRTIPTNETTPEEIEQALAQHHTAHLFTGVFCADRKTNDALEEIYNRRSLPYIQSGWKLIKDELLLPGRADELEKHVHRFLDLYLPASDREPVRMVKADFLSALATQAEPIRIDGFPQFSRSMKIRPQVSVVIAAETGGGKSSFALNLAHALNKEYPVLYFNLEMAARIVFERLLAIETGLTLEDIGKFGNAPELAQVIDEAADRLTSRQPFYLDNDKYKLSEVEQVIKATPREDDKPLIVFIDHLHLMSLDGGGNQSLYEKTTELAKALKQIAKRENLVLFLLAQQNRAGKADQSKKPTLASLKDSGELENSADKVVFIWEKKTDTLVPRTEATFLIIAKNREGQPGEEIEIEFDRDSQRIIEKGFKPTNEKEPVQFTQESIEDTIKAYKAIKARENNIEMR